MSGPLKVGLVGVVATGSIVTPGWTRQAGGGDAIVSSPAHEAQPAATSRYLAWTESPKAHPKKRRVYARRGNTTFRVSRKGTIALTTGGAIDGSTLVYWERPPGGNSNIKFFNLRAKKRRSGPGPVNTGKPEWAGTMSGRWLLFMRGFGNRTLFLYNKQTSNLRRLDHRRTTNNSLIQAGNVAGHFATWEDCPSFRSCRVIRLNINSGKRTRMPNPKNKSQYAASVTPNGSVFWVESENLASCNSAVKMYLKAPGKSRRKLMNFPDGTDASTLDAIGKKGRSIVYDQYNCNTFRADIYRLDR